ncbi:MAG: class I adenylate-forming enzyme family protein [Alphaproteobacteria bacterium]
MDDRTLRDLLEALPHRLHQIPERWAVRQPDAPALFEPDGARMSYAEFWAAIRSTGSWLAELGVRGGDRLMIVNENGFAASVLFHAASVLDAWPMLVNARLSDREIDEIRRHAEPRRTVYTTRVSPEAVAHARRHDAQQTRLPYGETVALSALAAVQPEQVHADSAKQVGGLVYTSGTTGAPKGVMLSHRALAYVASTPGAQKPIAPDDKFYGALPVSHIFGLSSTLLRALYGGGSVLCVPRFSAESLDRALRHEAVTILQAVPQMYAKLIEYFDATGLKPSAPHLRVMTVGGAMLDSDLKQKVEKLFGLTLINGWGMTEFASTVSRSTLDDKGAACPAGNVLPGIEVKTVDDKGRALPLGEAGELWLRGPNAMLGYYRNPTATAEVLTADGWYKTGDLGYVGDNGKLYILDRTRELIIRSGFNVYPAEVEAVLASHPSVTLAAVVGRASAGNEEVIAFVQLAPGAAPREAELIEFAAAQLAPYKRPARVIALEQLPAAATGKILKRHLKTMAAALPAGPGDA